MPSKMPTNMPSRLLPLLSSLALLVPILSAVEGRAASVFVRWEASTSEDPLYTERFDTRHSALADLAAGFFTAFSTASGSSLAITTGAGLATPVTLTNANPFPYTLYRGMLRAHVEGAYSVVLPGPGLATGADGRASLSATTSGPSPASFAAGFEHLLRRDGTPANDVNLVVPTSTGGGRAVVGEATFDFLVVDLSLPSFTLQPGQSVTLAFHVDAVAQRNSVADFFSVGGGQLFLDLPAGVAFSSDAATALGWIRVPEPACLPMLAAGGILLASLRRRAARRQGFFRSGE